MRSRECIKDVEKDAALEERADRSGDKIKGSWFMHIDRQQWDKGQDNMSKFTMCGAIPGLQTRDNGLEVRISTTNRIM